MKVPSAAFLLFAFLLPLSGFSGGNSTGSTAVPAADGSPRLSRGEFLVADYKMFDPRFEESVILITNFGPSGASGVIINRPTEMKLSHAFPDIEEFATRPDVLYIGGPVEPNRASLLIQSDRHPEAAEPVFENVYFGLEMDALLNAVRDGENDTSLRVYAGYAGWSPGQLEREVEHGWWRVLRADAGALFDMDPAGVWPTMIRRASGQWVDKNGKGPFPPDRFLGAGPARSSKPRLGRS